MNKSTTLRSEEARRQAQASVLHAKQQQDAMLKERAMMFASETQKVENLRAQRLARLTSGEIVETKVERAPARPARSVASAVTRGRVRDRADSSSREIESAL
jgi:hypothetical protein